MFSLPHPTDQQDLHVLPPKNEFNHVSAFLYLFPHHWGESLPTGPTMSILEPPSQIYFSNLQPENGLPVLLLLLKYISVASHCKFSNTSFCTMVYQPHTMAWPSLPFPIHPLPRISFSDYSCLGLFHLLSLLRQTKVFLASGYFYLFFPLPEAVLVRFFIGLCPFPPGFSLNVSSQRGLSTYPPPCL